MKGKTRTMIIILRKKECEMLGRVEELKQIQGNLDESKELLKIKSESLREMVRAYKKLQEEVQTHLFFKDAKVGKHLEFYDYPKLVFKVDGEDIFAKSDLIKEGLLKEGCELKEAKEE